jgi:hypothetical protein
MGRDKTEQRPFFNPTEDAPIRPLQGIAAVEGRGHDSSDMNVGYARPTDVSYSRASQDTRYERVQENKPTTVTNGRNSDVSFVSESQFTNAPQARKASARSEVEESLTSESLMMYSSDPSVLFGTSKLSKRTTDDYQSRVSRPTFLISVYSTS